MKNLLNVSAAPHIRSKETTSSVMFDVVLALLPATAFGIWHFGFHAFMIVATSVLTAVMTEFIYDYITHSYNTTTDFSAVVTGLLLALCLSPTVPLYIPYLGSLFAILFVKCVFGGLGQNFMNPAAAGRCFLMISFSSIMTDFGVDGVSRATTLAVLESGSSVSVLDSVLGFTSGVIGLCPVALIIGGIYLLAKGHITWHIPVSYILSFVILEMLVTGQPLNFNYYIVQVCSGGVLMGALFMATDPATSPMTARGQIILGVFLGLMTATFRAYGSAADSVAFVIIIGNLLVPLIDIISVPKPFGVGDNAKKPKPKIPRSAMILCVITLIAGIALGLVNYVTKDAIEAQNMAANLASYQVVVPDAEEFVYDETINDYISEYASEEVYGNGSFGKVYINEVVVGQDASGNTVGYAVSVTTAEGFDGNITVSVGFTTDGTINGISFTEINETAGMGMRADEDEWKAQFAGVKVDSFTLNKSGGSTADDEIDSVSGASVTSSAVVNAVNAAIDLFNGHIAQ